MSAAVLSVGSVAVLFYQVLQQQVEVQIRDALNTEVHAIESQLTPVQQSLQNLGGVVQWLHANEVQKPETYKALQLNFFQKRPSLVMGISLQQTPYGILTNRQWFASYLYTTQDAEGEIGTPLPYPNDAVIYADLVKEDNAPNQSYYTQTIEIGKDSWLEPYLWYNITMTTANHLLFDEQNHLLGFVSMDVDLTALSQQLQGTVMRNSGYFMILSEQGNLIAYPPDPAKVRQSYTVIPSLKALWPQFQTQSSGLFCNNGQYWAYQRIPNTNWLMLAVVPRSVVLIPVLVIALGGALAAGGILALVIGLFVRRLNRRLKPILDECQKLVEADNQRLRRLGTRDVAASNELIAELNSATADELDVLAYSFHRMAEQLKVSFDKLELREEELLHSALHDTLTLLPNRMLLMERLDLALQEVRQRDDYAFAVLFIDSDRFKLINDSLGHQVGDQLLVAIAHHLKAVVRPTDTVARLGGDEFVILLEPISDITDAIHIVERISNNLQAPLQIQGHEVFISVSIGIALGSSNYHSADDLLRDADIAMYRAKQRGRARYELFDQVMRTQTMRQLQLKTDLHHALEHQEFHLHYQPIVSIKTGLLVGFEALIRWQHPTRGLVYPNEFIPTAEETKLIVPLGEWVLRSACQQLAYWHSQCLTTPPLTLSINLSVTQLQEPGLIDTIDEILAQTHLSGQSLKLEITESALMDSDDNLLNVLAQLKARSIELSLDDFGVGYSSLSYLHQFPISYLKIDRSFVNRIGNGNDDDIVETIINLAHQMKMQVIAEGIETRQQLQTLKQLSCEAAQGFLFSKPLNPEVAEALILTNIHWDIAKLTELNLYKAE